jgi:hypothetical protein
MQINPSHFPTFPKERRTGDKYGRSGLTTNDSRLPTSQRIIGTKLAHPIHSIGIDKTGSAIALQAFKILCIN